MISERVQRQIQDEPDGVPYQSIATKYGVSWYHVKNIRMRAGKNQPKSGVINHSVKMERIPDPVSIEGGTMYDRVIEALEEQVAIYTQALEVVRGLRDVQLGA